MRYYVRRSARGICIPIRCRGDAGTHGLRREIARRIWRVTYSSGYLENHRELAEDQMRREITAPTPLHAADLQYQAFAEFDCSKVLPNIKAPTLVMTGDLDDLVSPRNSKLIASLIPGARLIVIPGCGHRMMWEATDECVGIRHGIPDRCFRRASRSPGFACLAGRPDSAGRFRPFTHACIGAFCELAVDAGRSRRQFNDDRPAIDLFRRQGAVWRRQTSCSDPGPHQPSAFPDARKLAQGTRLSSGHDRAFRGCRRPIAYRLDTCNDPTGRPENGAGNPRLRNPARVSDRGRPQGLGVRHRRPQCFAPS